MTMTTSKSSKRTRPGVRRRPRPPKANAPGPSQAPAQADQAKGSQAAAAAAAKAPGGKAKGGEGDAKRAARRAVFLAAAHRVAAQLLAEVEAAAATDPAARAAAIAARLSGAQGPAPPLAAQQPPAENAKHFSTEIEINDFPQKARWKVTHRDSVFRMSEEYNVSITGESLPLSLCPCPSLLGFPSPTDLPLLLLHI